MIPKDRVFGIGGELYKILLEVEPPTNPNEQNEDDNPPPPPRRQESMDTNKHGDTSAEDTRSQKSSRNGSENGSNIGSGASNTRGAAHGCQQKKFVKAMMEPPLLC